MTVNHDVAGSSPAGGARKALRKKCFFHDVCLTANDVAYANDVSFGNDVGFA